MRFVSPALLPRSSCTATPTRPSRWSRGDDVRGADEGGVPASFIRIEGAGHGFEGANLERATAAMVQWFQRHLGT